MGGARWAGVALVIAALVGAITLAVISPSDPRGSVRAGIGADVEPAASSGPPPSIAPDARVPQAQPEIIGPEDGSTTVEREMRVLVTVPEYELPRDAVQLDIYRNGKLVDSEPMPPADDVEVGPIRLAEGRNEITAALASSSGSGPMSAPIVIDVDKVGPAVDIASPAENARVYTRSIDVSGTTEVGAQVTIINRTNGRQKPLTVGPSGAFETSMLLDQGRNRIVILVVDEAGNAAPRIRRGVTRLDPQPEVKLRLSKSRIDVASLPRSVTATAIVTDSSGRPIEGADVIFAISLEEQPARTSRQTTNAKGQARWRIEIPREGAGRGEGIVTMEATFNGATEERTKKLVLR